MFGIAGFVHQKPPSQFLPFIIAQAVIFYTLQIRYCRRLLPTYLAFVTLFLQAAKFVGREQELQTLTDALDQALVGKGLLQSWSKHKHVRSLQSTISRLL